MLLKRKHKLDRKLKFASFLHAENWQPNTKRYEMRNDKWTLIPYVQRNVTILVPPTASVPYVQPNVTILVLPTASTDDKCGKPIFKAHRNI